MKMTVAPAVFAGAEHPVVVVAASVAVRSEKHALMPRAAAVSEMATTAAVAHRELIGRL
jgi:hypothetical protein